MKSRLLRLFSLVLIAPTCLFASNGKGAKLVAGSQNESVITFSTGVFDQQAVSTPWGQAVIIKSEGATPILKKGAPDLPKLTASVIIPDLAHMEVKVVSGVYVDYPNTDIAPSKGTLFRSTDKDAVPFEKGSEYAQNQFFPGTLAGLRDPYIIRDLRGQTVVAYPFQYNPVTRVLRVYSEITVKVTKKDDNGINPLYRNSAFETVDAQFANIYENHFLNKNVFPLYTPLGEYGNMLIICNDPYMAAMQPFVDWKIKIGIPVTMVPISSVGNNATSIKNYIQNFYTTNGLTFVLLVGDAQHITPMYFAASGDSDVGYSYLVGNDRYPDIFVGRFSAESITDVTVQVNRTIEYERNPVPNDPWYKTGMGIASDQGPGDDNQMDYQHIRTIGSVLTGYTYSSMHEMFDGSQGGQDAPGNPTPAMISNAINAGLSIINYCGHGSASSWVSSGFSSANVDNLTNNGKYPFIFSVACVNGDFNGNFCFAEHWLRARDVNGQPRGAVGAIMSTINQYWDEPMEGQDAMNDILSEAYSNNIKRTFGGITMNACMQMNDAYGTSGMDMTDTWTIFGDPSVMVRTDNPAAMTVSHPATDQLGVSQLTVTCNTDGALVCLMLNGNVLGTGFVSGGSATIAFAPVTMPDTIHITVTAYNKVPYFGIDEVLPFTGMESAADAAFLIYPNPAQDVLNVIASDAQSTMSLYNMVGEVLISASLTQGTNAIDLSALPAGLYTVRMEGGAGTFSKKIIKY
ncbi:MAG: C25 family cysteine peptidase [Bacteroidota bacterium]